MKFWQELKKAKTKAEALILYKKWQKFNDYFLNHNSNLNHFWLKKIDKINKIIDKKK